MLAVPVRVVEGKLVDPNLASEVVLRQERPEVREVVFLGDEDEVGPAAGISVAVDEGVSGGAATDDDHPLALSCERRLSVDERSAGSIGSGDQRAVEVEVGGDHRPL